MKKNMKKAKRVVSTMLAMALALGLFAASPVLASAEDLPDLAIGTWAGTGANPGDGHRYVTMGNYNGHELKWRVLDVYVSDGKDGNTEGSKTALLLMDDLLRTPSGDIDYIRFNAHNSNWAQPSELNLFLNDGFFNGVFSADEQAGIITSNYSMGGPYEGNYGFPAAYSSKVFMLSTDEAANPAYFAGNADRTAEYYWWLRSPGDSDISAAYVDLEGAAIGVGFDYFFNYIGVRPALKISLPSDTIAPDPTVCGVAATAFVEKLSGSKNNLTITVTEQLTDGSLVPVTVKFSIGNNAAATYSVGSYKVYVDTKGNTQIRECRIVE
ncbi:MAG: DUF6273 domain-containing protein [Clostridiales bacterium]|nr:DUF6273 domain-containing protein [Clostridiales bacterium]